MKRRAARAWLQATVPFTLALVFFAPGIFLGQLPVFRDLLVLVLPLRQYTADALWRGEIPLWAEEIFLGAPYLANYQSAVLYPPSLIPGLGSVPFGFSLYLAFHLFVAALGTTLYLARVGGLHAPAALFGGVVFAFGGFIFSLVSLTNQLAGAAWLPWVLFAAHRLQTGASAGAFVSLALVASLQLLAGAPEVALLTVGLVAADAARGLAKGDVQIRSVVLAGGAFAFATAIAAAQLLPTFEYIGLTNRADGLPYAEVASESFEPASFFQLLLPHTFEGGAPGFMPEPGVPLFWSLYLGVAPLVMVAAALASRPPRLWIAVAAFSALLAMGSHFILFPAVHALSPGFVGAFRYAGKLFLPAHLALAVLAAFGLARAIESSRSRAVGMIAGGAITVFGLFVSAGVHLDAEAVLRALGYDLRVGLSAETYATIGAQLSAKGHRAAAFAAVTVCLLWFLSRARIGTSVFAGLITLASFLDLLTVHQPSLAFTDWASFRATEETRPAVVRAGERVFHYSRESDGRISPWLGRIRIAESVEKRARSLWNARVPDLPVLDGGTSVAGVDGFSPYVRLDFYRALVSLRPEGALRLLAALGTERVVGEEPLAETASQPVIARDDPSLYVYDLPEAAPRTYLAERMSIAPDRLRALLEMAQPEFRPGRDAVLLGTGNSVRRLGRGTIESLSIERESIHAAVTVDAPSLWVVSDTWSPGWQATVDGAPVEVLNVNGVARGIAVPSGRHLVEMHYHPAPFRAGKWVSVVALALLLPVALVAARLAPSADPATPDGIARQRTFAWRAARAALLVATFVLPVVLMTGKSITSDEVAHLPAGYSYLRTGIVRLNPMHPPLVKEISALPLLFLDPDLPLPAEDLEDPDLPIAAQWRYGTRFLERADLETVLFRGRLMVVLLSVGLGVVIVLWGRSLWGDAGAALALFLYAFDPTITAHAQLVTTDVGAAFFFAAYLFSLRGYVHDASAVRLLVTGILLGLALGSKFSGVFLLPISAALFALAAWIEPGRFGAPSRARALATAAASLLTMAVVATLVLWALYFFPLDPSFYLRGLRTVNLDHRPDHPFFLMGELEPCGWPYYLLIAWLVKTPVPTLLLLGGAVFAFARRHRASFLEEAFLVVPGLSLFAAYSAFADPIGVRYLIPCFPYLFLFAGRLAPAVAGLARPRIAAAALAFWVFVEYASIWPDHLSYFNQVAGGPRGGVAWLDDSNVDWGQGMIRLGDYVKKRGLADYRTCFLQNFDWSAYGVGGRPIGIRELMTPPPEMLVLSAHCVARARVYLKRLYGNELENWMAHVQPASVVGHAYYIYDLRTESR